MDVDSDQYRLKELLVDVESKHEHLQASVNHLQSEIDKREIEIKKLVAERELKLAQQQSYNLTAPSTATAAPSQVRRPRKSQSVDFQQTIEEPTTGNVAYSSEFTKQVDQLLDRITRTSKEVSALIKL